LYNILCEKGRELVCESRGSKILCGKGRVETGSLRVERARFCAKKEGQEPVYERCQDNAASEKGGAHEDVEVVRYALEGT
jgi:hypothetical protein